MFLQFPMTLYAVYVFENFVFRWRGVQKVSVKIKIRSARIEQYSIVSLIAFDKTENYDGSG